MIAAVAGARQEADITIAIKAFRPAISGQPAIDRASGWSAALFFEERANDLIASIGLFQIGWPGSAEQLFRFVPRLGWLCLQADYLSISDQRLKNIDWQFHKCRAFPDQADVYLTDVDYGPGFPIPRDGAAAHKVDGMGRGTRRCFTHMRIGKGRLRIGEDWRPRWLGKWNGVKIDIDALSGDQEINDVG